MDMPPPLMVMVGVVYVGLGVTVQFVGLGGMVHHLLVPMDLVNQLVLL